MRGLPASTQLLGYTRGLFRDTASRALDERRALVRAFDHLRAADALVVWRSLRHLVDTVASLADRDVGFRSCRSRSPGIPGAHAHCQSTVALQVGAEITDTNTGINRWRLGPGTDAAGVPQRLSTTNAGHLWVESY